MPASKRSGNGPASPSPALFGLFSLITIWAAGSNLASGVRPSASRGVVQKRRTFLQ